MPIEIERKYLVKGFAYRNIGKPVFYKQGYLSTDINNTVRVRIVEDKGFITIKGKNKKISRLEFEYPIPKVEAVEIIEKLCPNDVIEKIRYCVYFEGKKWEIDEFKGANEGLVVAEIELTAEDEKFSSPPWIGQEVTSDWRYFNSNLVKYPFKEWS